MDHHLLAYIASAVLIVLGIIGTAVLLPGVPVVFAGMLLAAWADDFRVIPVWAVVVLAVLTLLAIAVDSVASLLGAKRVGASRLAIAGAAAGTIVGLFFGLPGLLFGPFLGAIGGELLHGRDLDHATRVGMGTWIGMIVGMLFKLVLVFAMLGIFLFAIFVR
ncbi:MAG TPA: DUF456 domain-containing protein [Xanthomonadaceae bacterium]|jgi:hypothetical protein